MAKQIITQFIDDIDGSEAAETVEFGLDGQTYEIDLSADKAAALREALAEYVQHSRRTQVQKVRRARKPRGTTSGPTQTQKLREWARERGFQVSDRGRISREIQEAYATRGPDSVAHNVTDGDKGAEDVKPDTQAEPELDTSSDAIKAWWIKEGNTEPKTVTPTIRKKYLTAMGAR